MKLAKYRAIEALKKTTYTVQGYYHYYSHYINTFYNETRIITMVSLIGTNKSWLLYKMWMFVLS